MDCKDCKKNKPMEEFVSKYRNKKIVSCLECREIRKTRDKEYRLNNKDKINKLAKDYNDKNKDMIQQKRDDKKEEKKIKDKERFTCECGKSILKKNRWVHYRTPRHLELVEK
tara:strand:+ start:356 stop:691 length:336 start_codon:yes stop_codon:yes gene_type:complete